MQTHLLQKIFMIFIFVGFSAVNAHAENLEKKVSLFLDEYNMFMKKPSFSKFYYFFSIDVTGTYKFFDLGSNTKTKCPQGGCVVVLNTEKIEELIKNSKNTSDNSIQIIERNIDYPKKNYVTIVRTELLEIEFSKKTNRLEDIIYTEKIFLTLENKQLKISKLEVVIKSVTESKSKKI